VDRVQQVAAGDRADVAAIVATTADMVMRFDFLTRSPLL
jgi:hypothetical protein